ncbi:Tim44 domain-containing protein [Clostridium sardiniense]|uniref:Tim44 domain-containing protein n=1 Tax=Clostridium sardiniense TaxID=29369 RepID=UPI003D3449BF
MKKHYKKIIKILILVILILPTTSAFPIAGGGSGGGGGGGAGGGSGGRSGGSSGRGGSSGASVESQIISGALGIFTFVGGFEKVKRKIILKRKKDGFLSAIKEFKKYDLGWEYNDISNDITTAFYLVQEAWTKRNQDIAREYMSKKLYTLHKTKTEWMKVREEKNILKDVELLEVIPIGALNSKDKFEDMIWVNIKCSMVDYTINEKTNSIIDGNKSKHKRYEQFWRFKRDEKHWVLDEIKWPNEIEDIDSYFNIEEENSLDLIK